MIQNDKLRNVIKSIDPSIPYVYDGAIPVDGRGVAIREIDQESKKICTFDNSTTTFMVELKGINNEATRLQAEALFKGLKLEGIWTSSKRELVTQMDVYINFQADVK